MLPGVAQVAIQQGIWAAEMIARDREHQPRREFRYHDKGSLATIGRAAAVAQFGKFELSGYFAWLAWLFIHILFLIGFRNRTVVMINWAWAYLTYERGARLITGSNELPGWNVPAANESTNYEATPPVAVQHPAPRVSCPLRTRYNGLVVRRAVSLLAVSLFLCAVLHAQEDPASGRTLVVIPFDNTSSTPGLEWLGEGFAEALRAQLDSPVLYVATRDERLRAYDRLGIPSGVHPSRATLYRIADQMDVDYALLGSCRFDGENLTVSAQLLDMRAPRLLPAITESGRAADLGRLESSLAWDLLRSIRANFSVPKDKYVAAAPAIRTEAWEGYVRGILAATADERVQHFREAVRSKPGICNSLA